MIEDLDTLLGRDPIELRAAVQARLEALGWGDKLGKERGGVQTLLEHALAVFDVVGACLPFFAADTYPKLTARQAMTVLLAALAHDAGKAAPGPQAYLRGEPVGFASHVDRDEIHRIVVDVARSIGADVDESLEDIVSSAVLHDRFERRDKGELYEFTRPHTDTRWRKLADIVNHADSLASVPDVVAAESFLARNPLLVGSAVVASYRLRVRGVITTHLHDATRDTFEARGFKPIVYFADGTVFAGPTGASEPTRNDVTVALRERFERLFAERSDKLTDLALGVPTGNFLPQPEYVRADNVEALFEAAIRKVGRKSELTAESRETYAGQWSEAVASYRAAEKQDPPFPLVVNPVEVQALQDIGPEACAFMLAKKLFTEVLDDSDAGLLRSLYDARFGEGAFDVLLGQSTYMPVRDYLSRVRPWHERPASDFDEVSSARVGELEPTRRVKILSKTLASIFKAAVARRSAPLPCETVIGEWIACAMSDLSLEGLTSDEVTAEPYSALKVRPRTANAALLCVQCGSTIPAGTALEPSASLGNAGTYSNRRIAFEGPGSPPICRPCAADIRLGQLTLGGPIETAITLLPRRSFGPAGGRAVLEAARALRSIVDRQLAPATTDPGRFISLTLPPVVLRAIADAGLGEALLGTVSPQTLKKRIKRLESTLSDRVDPADLVDLNTDCGTCYASLEELADAIVSGTAPTSIREDADVQAAVKAARFDPLLDFGTITPNLVVVSLSQGISSDEAAVEVALYSFALAALFARELGTAALVAPPAELRTALTTRGGRSVYVPANGPARRLLGGDWLRLDEASRWLRAVRAAIALREYAGARTTYEVLTFPSAGFLVRRVELRSEGAGPWLTQWPHVEALKEVLG